ncbi:lipid storage droplets surface-binding protein 2 isoform X2 [Nilaparvata lugens]|uniref:lipid storage droplets surface-binding protein 2 isoform X1 n=1 Tax=Nilaparvata lugens TaxID=108931 RepID=UPI000B99D282|nr:lipid storage droplets surface-binding protein 2 isoform X1 [Nilaparvata lugens]XP_039277428.1 lipid storage droplets surface-binding protein 2 isoform X2 [Nilaparvata lugens]
MLVEGVPSAMPHLEVVNKLWTFPVVESAWNTSSSMYGRVKGYNSLTNWTLNTAEGAMQLAFEQVAPIVVKRFEQPIQAVDGKLCAGLNKLEEKVPLVKEQPQQVYEKAKTYAVASIQPAVDAVQARLQQAKSVNVRSLKDLSYSKANELLTSQYGNLALAGLDTTTGMAERCLDYYLPALDQQDEQSHLHSNLECDDKVSHTLHTVGVLSNKVGRRVYYNVSHHLTQINQKNIADYLSSLYLVIQLTEFLNAINKKVEERTRNETPQQS